MRRSREGSNPLGRIAPRSIVFVQEDFPTAACHCPAAQTTEPQIVQMLAGICFVGEHESYLFDRIFRSIPIAIAELASVLHLREGQVAARDENAVEPPFG